LQLHAAVASGIARNVNAMQATAFQFQRLALHSAQLAGVTVSAFINRVDRDFFIASTYLNSRT
jgi:hypothetical protein